MYMKKVAKAFVSVFAILCLLVQSASVAWANDSNVQDEDLFSVLYVARINLLICQI